MVAIMTKIAGNTIIGNATNVSGNVIPTYQSTVSGSPKGATMLRIFNNTILNANVFISNNGVNIGFIVLQANNIEYVQKYPSDLIYVQCGSNAATTANGILITPVALTW